MSRGQTTLYCFTLNYVVFLIPKYKTKLYLNVLNWLTFKRLEHSLILLAAAFMPRGKRVVIRKGKLCASKLHTTNSHTCSRLFIEWQVTFKVYREIIKPKLILLFSKCYVNHKFELSCYYCIE